MRITLNTQEKKLMREYAEKYREQTGDNYSIFHICSILTDIYEEKLVEDLKVVMDIKLREYQEEQNND